MLTHDYVPLFKLDHMLKDVRLCLEEALAAGAAFPAAALAGELYAAAAGRGLGDQDFAAVLEVVEALSDVSDSVSPRRGHPNDVADLSDILGSKTICDLGVRASVDGVIAIGDSRLLHSM